MLLASISDPIASFSLADEIEQRHGTLHHVALAQIRLRSPKERSSAAIRESWMPKN
jgi:hypothetical protein